MSERDRKTTTLERTNPTHPLPPLNLNVLWVHSSDVTAFDLRWDDPASLGQNSGFDILGVNVYRSFDAEWGPYHRLNDQPVGATFWRDKTELVFKDGEDVTNRFISADDEASTWVFQVRNAPIVKPGTDGVPTDDPRDVIVTIDGVDVRPARVNGRTGEVELDATTRYDVESNDTNDALLPRADSIVTCDYWYRSNRVTREHNQRIFYLVTTVARSEWDNELLETPFGWCEPKSVVDTENMGYIWNEAIRRNRWILEQGGERVKVFVRKHVGPKCPCTSDRGHRGHGRQNCQVCFGVGIRGGYEGPWDILVAPRDSERRIAWEDTGTHEEQTDSVWTGPAPLLSQRDFIVKQNGDRFSVGAVHLPTNRGVILQQHFEVGLMDRDDIRQDVPVTGVDDLAFPETRTTDWDDERDEVDNPQITEKESVPDGVEQRGRTPTYENIQY